MLPKPGSELHPSAKTTELIKIREGEAFMRPPTIPHRARSLGRRLLMTVALVAALTALNAIPAHAQTSADSSVTLTWTAPGDDGDVGRATTYDIRYRTVGISATDTTSWWNAATQVTGEPAPSTAGSTDSMRVRGLTPLTTYYFLLRAADEVANWSGYSNVAVKATGGDATPPAAIADLSVTGQTGTSLSLRWTAPGDDGNTGTATSYDIRYSTSAITAANWNSATQATGEPTPAAPGTVQTFSLTGLTGSRTYYVAIRTFDNAGNLSTLSNVVSGTTADTIAPAPVRDLSYGPVDAHAPAADLVLAAAETGQTGAF
jgi:Fibronectin type III domain